MPHPFQIKLYGGLGLRDGRWSLKVKPVACSEGRQKIYLLPELREMHPIKNLSFRTSPSGISGVQENSCIIPLGEKGRRAPPETLSARRF
jgi:hypothetical protein